MAHRTFGGQHQGFVLLGDRQHAVVCSDFARHGVDQAFVELERIEWRPFQVQLFGQGLHQLRGVDVPAQQQFLTQASAYRVGDRGFELIFRQQAFFHQAMAQRGALGFSQGRKLMGGLVPGDATGIAHFHHLAQRPNVGEKIHEIAPHHPGRRQQSFAESVKTGDKPTALE
ncbi:hypothetical protein D3C81_620490 [compost metagenome]